MIHSAITQTRSAVIVAWFWSFGTDGRTICVKIVITTGQTVVGLVDQFERRWTSSIHIFEYQYDIRLVKKKVSLACKEKKFRINFEIDIGERARLTKALRDTKA